MSKATASTLRIIRPSGRSVETKQGLAYVCGVSAESVGADALCMHMLKIPPGGRGKAHTHARHETALYILSGESGVWYGDGLKEDAVARAGDFIYIPAGVPHKPVNTSDSEPCVAIVARTDPSEQESAILMPAPDGSGEEPSANNGG